MGGSALCRPRYLGLRRALGAGIAAAAGTRLFASNDGALFFKVQARASAGCSGRSLSGCSGRVRWIRPDEALPRGEALLLSLSLHCVSRPAYCARIVLCADTACAGCFDGRRTRCYSASPSGNLSKRLGTVGDLEKQRSRQSCILKSLFAKRSRRPGWTMRACWVELRPSRTHRASVVSRRAEHASSPDEPGGGAD